VKIATGTAEQHETPLPYSPPDDGLAGVTARAPGASGPPDAGVLVTGVRDLTGERLAQLAAGEADIASAQASGMAAEGDRRSGYQAQALPLGSHIGDDLVLPAVPTNAVPPAMSDLYPWSGQEPTPADAPGVYGGS
jgi:hypothetical protein